MRKFVIPCGLLVFAALLTPAERPGQKKSRHMPMTSPESMLALHEQKYGHSVSWVELEDGRILMCGGSKFRISTDKGITWSEEFRGRDETGKNVDGLSLVNLKGGAVGILTMRKTPGSNITYDYEMYFRRSTDAGKTWHDPVLINPRDREAFVWQDMMMRTSSGRIILPVYNSLGQSGFHLNGAPNTGGFINGTGGFITTDAHFYDPGFSGSYVYYSDDEGKTWQPNRDGELIVHVTPGGQIEWTAEPAVAEISPGKLIMMLRTRLGRMYQSISTTNGETWGTPQPTQLASTQTPAQVRLLKGKAKNHLLCVFNQQSEREIRQGMVRTRLSSAISRNGGALWEHFQNVESLHEEPHVEPGPIRVVHPAGYRLEGGPAPENPPEDAVPLPEGWGRWSYPSVLVLDDRVLISHTYSWHEESGERINSGGSRLKVLPLSWLYGNRDPFPSPTVDKLSSPPQP